MAACRNSVHCKLWGYFIEVPFEYFLGMEQQLLNYLSKVNPFHIITLLNEMRYSSYYLNHTVLFQRAAQSMEKQKNYTFDMC